MAKEHAQAVETPAWLLETQNKSWEPEILISGISLTFVFLLAEPLYNFCAMLIQQYGVYHAVAQKLYALAAIYLTGLKTVLILHLALRGMWTGFVGLSYVFPHGINMDRMPKDKRHIDYPKPVAYVKKLETICSLLFSFIYSSVVLSAGTLIIFVPIILLFVAGLDPYYIRIATLGLVGLMFLLAVVYSVFMFFRSARSRLVRKVDRLNYAGVMNIYATNLGTKKTLLVFALFFLLMFGLSRRTISSFDFDNRKSAPGAKQHGLLRLRPEHYLDQRNPNLRVSKAAINSFQAAGSLRLFISLYKQDTYTVKAIAADPARLDGLKKKPWARATGVPYLYRIRINDVPVADLSWVIMETPGGQQGMVTDIPLTKCAAGLHLLHIDKLLWSVKKQEINLISDWDVIPFGT